MIAEEAIGQRHGSAPDYAPTKADMSQEILQLAPSSGAQASIPEKTAESVGERVGDAYSDPARIAQYPKGKVGRLTATAAGSHKRDENNRFLSVGRGVTQERFISVVAGFALGYVTAVLFQGRINAYFGTTPGPFQITKPPQGDRHYPPALCVRTPMKSLDAVGTSSYSFANRGGNLLTGCGKGRDRAWHLMIVLAGPDRRTCLHRRRREAASGCPLSRSR